MPKTIVTSVLGPLGSRFAVVATVWMALAFALAGCVYPGQSAYWGRAVPGAVSSALVEQRIQQYRDEYELEPRPQGTPQEIAEAYMRRYQPGPLPRIFESSYVYDRHGQLIAEIVDEGRRIWMPIDQISPYLIQALVSTEDGSFFDNSGIDHRRIVGAMLQNLGNPEQLSGASTITMQLARNLFMQPEERFAISIERKIDEVLLAQDLTRLFTKHEILEMYLNLAYFGHLAYGPEAAARTYFGKSALELTWAEATLLAGLLQQPANLDPFFHLENAKARQRIVLDMLVRRGYLTQTEADRIYDEPILLGEDPNLRANLAPHFLVFLADYLERQPEAYQLSRNGLVVYTTLDLAMQQLGEEIIRTQVEKLRPIYNLTNAALVAIKPGTGEILTMVGSVDFGNQRIGGQVNVTLRERQPGSALKPILYASAFDANLISPATLLWDLSVTYPIVGARDYRPRNYDGKLRGPITARMALANSLNVPAVKLMDSMGLERFVETANRMGVASLTEEDIRAAGLAMTLGGSEVTLFELTTAYSTLANGGLFVEPTPILHLFDGRGQRLPLSRSAPQEAVSAQAAFLVTDILSDNDARTPIFGANSSLRLSRPAMAKTGTTTSFRDNWTVGFTRYLVAGVWSGNNDGRPMRNATGVTGAAPIWRAFMEAVMADPALLDTLGAPEEEAAWRFTPPAGVRQIDQPCPPQLRCRTGGEFFTERWLARTALTGPYVDSFAYGLLSEVQVELRNGRRVLSGVCLQQRAAAGDPDARTALALPRGFGWKSPQWRFADTLPDVDSLDITQTLSGTLDLAIRPFLPTPDTRRPAIYAFASAVRDEQQAALTWSRNRGVPLYLGTCAEADGVARALYGKEVRTVAVSAPPRPLATAPITDTKVLTESIAQVTPDAIPAALSSSSGTYGLAVVGADNNCPGNYVVGRVLNAAGGPVPGVTVRMVDQWGNQSVAVSKSGASDFGRFDFPLYPSGPRDLYVTVLDERGSPASPTITLRYPPPEGTPCYYVEWKRTTG